MSSSEVKAEVVKQVRTQYAMENAKQLIDKVNEHCFEKCIAKPSTSLSSGEQTCFTSCMEKYMGAWNQVNAAFIGRMQREQGNQ